MSKWAKIVFYIHLVLGLIFLLFGNSVLGQQVPMAPDSFPKTIDSLPVGHITEKNQISEPAPVSLQELITQAMEHNPEIKSMQRSFDRMRARIPQAKALPEPTLSYSYAGNINPLPFFDLQKEDPASARMLNFTQEIPFPGKLALKEKMASVEADSEWWNYQQTRLNVMAEMKDIYFDWWYILKAIQVITKNKDLLEKFTQIADARYAVGKGIQQDVLKAQVEISKLIDQLTVLEQRKLTTEARLNSLLFRDPDSPLGRPEELMRSDFSWTLTQLKETAVANFPTIQAQKRKVDRERYGIQLAQKEFYPDFSFGFTYFHRPQLPEMYGLTIGVKLPLYFWKKQRPALTEASASSAMEQKRLENLTTVLFFKLKERYLAVTTAQRLIKLYGTTIIPQATLSLDSAIAGYEVGKVDFLTLLDNLVTLLNYQLSYYEQLSNEKKALASIEPYLGMELTR